MSNEMKLEHDQQHNFDGEEEYPVFESSQSTPKSPFTTQRIRQIFNRLQDHGNPSTTRQTNLQVQPHPQPASKQKPDPVRNIESKEEVPKPSEVEIMNFLATQHENNLTVQRLQKRAKFFEVGQKACSGVVPRLRPDCGSQSEEESAGGSRRKRLEGKRHGETTLPGADIAGAATNYHLNRENAFPPIQVLKRKANFHLDRNKNAPESRDFSSSDGKDGSARIIPRVQRKIPPRLQIPPLSPLSARPLLQSSFAAYSQPSSPSPLLPPARSSYHHGHHKSSSASSKISEYIGNSADMLDQTRRELQNTISGAISLPSTMDLFWREKIIDDSDSDESFFCIGEDGGSSKEAERRKRREKELTMEELDKERRLSGIGHDPWTEGVLSECQLCGRPSPRGMKGLCHECEHEFRRTKMIGIYEGNGGVKERGYMKRPLESKAPQSLTLAKSMDISGNSISLGLSSGSQRIFSQPVHKEIGFKGRPLMLKSPRHDSQFAIIQVEENFPTARRTKAISITSVKSAPGGRDMIPRDDIAGVYRSSSQSLNFVPNPNLLPLIDKSHRQLPRYAHLQDIHGCRDSRTVFERWQSTDVRTQYKKQEKLCEKWSPAMLERDNLTHVSSVRKNCSETNCNSDEKNEDETKPNVVPGERRGHEKWKGKGVDRNESFFWLL